MEGEIQINGKTVINSEGLYVGTLPIIPPENKTKEIILKDYFNFSGVYKYKQTNYFETGSLDGSERDLGICDVTIEIDEFSSKHITKCENEDKSRYWTWTDNQDGTETITSKYFQEDVDMNGNIISGEWKESTYKYKVKLISDEVNRTTIGSTLSYITERTSIEPPNENVQNNNMLYLDTTLEHFSASIANITVNNVKYNDCYSVDNYSFDIRCKGVGLVKSVGMYINEELVSFEPTVSTRSNDQLKNVNRALQFRSKIHKKEIVK
ncbi:hypothetical protein [Photobacterium phosphoreum]|uniref:hypothetical protein n=1 Tax=Photobacterium phosphoreum TaxID=659 RepID=UPI000D165FA3|nr:hypothetical protein [Photobacterium phosphoreum]PSU56076.1 hypothetical protein CTM75_19115 [Photobacterium phosphoreum]